MALCDYGKDEKGLQLSSLSFSGPSPLWGHSQLGLGCIGPAGSELRFPPPITVTLKREAKLHDCSGFILGETLLGRY